MNPSRANEICQHTSSSLPSQTVLNHGQPESTTSDGRSTDSTQCEMFDLALVISKQRILNAQVL